MDKIQKVLIKAGRKDLAQEYFEKVAGKSLEELMVAAKKIKDEYTKLKSEASKHPNNESLQGRLIAKEEQLRRVANAIRAKKDEALDKAEERRKKAEA